MKGAALHFRIISLSLFTISLALARHLLVTSSVVNDARFPASAHRLTVYFAGQVQGIGFRYTAQNLALRYNVHGFVRNLPDGRVEMVMEGPPDEMNHLVDALRQKMTGYIRNVDLQENSATGEFSRFSIKH
jgi:acylphosphatase